MMQQLKENRKLQELTKLQALIHHTMGHAEVQLVNNKAILTHHVQTTQLSKVVSQLPQLESFFIAYGASDNLVFPFVADYQDDNFITTGTTILNALHIRNGKIITYLFLLFLFGLLCPKKIAIAVL